MLWVAWLALKTDSSLWNLDKFAHAYEVRRSIISCCSEAAVKPKEMKEFRSALYLDDENFSLFLRVMKFKKKWIFNDEKLFNEEETRNWISFYWSKIIQ